jgi:tetratricopeptide (TPR) repeat protein
MVAETRSLAPEFPFSQADAASAALRELSRYDVVLRGPLGPAPPPADEDEDLARPTDARGFEVRGAGYFARGLDDKAIADFTEAARLEPGAARHLYDRGAAYFHKGDLLHAKADFDAALRLDPTDLQALMGRADLEFASGDTARADADYAAALRQAPGSSTVLLRRAAANERQGRFDAAARDYDAADAAGASVGAKRAALLNAACFARGEWGRELEAGLAQCEAALKLLPEQPDILDSEGFVLVRLGRFEKAIDAYDAAIRGAPRSASSLFGRGLAKAALGRLEAGLADIAAARAAAPGIDAVFARYGLKAPALRHSAGR